MIIGQVVNPFQPIVGLTGVGLNGGEMYIGVEGMDPETDPQDCFWDPEGLIPAQQPIDILGGYPMRLGTPTRVYTADTYSIRVRDRQGQQVFYEASVSSSQGGASASIYATRADAEAATIPAEVKAVYLQGYYAAGDLGDGLFTRATGLPTLTGAYFRSQDRFLPDGSTSNANGGYWLYVPTPRGVNARAFGIKGDGVTDDTANAQNALNFYAGLNNTGAVVQGSGQVHFPPGDYRITKLSVPPGMLVTGDGIDPTIFRATAGYAGRMFELKRPASIPSSFTRRYSLRDLQIVGSGIASCVGVYCERVAELEFTRVGVSACDIGMEFNDSIVCEINLCKISGCISQGIKAYSGCNGYTILNTRVNATTAGPNIQIDGGGLQGFGWLLDNVVIESALHATAGIGLLIGHVDPVQAVQVNNCYFENNNVACIRVGSAAVNFSTVTVIAPFMTKGAFNPFGVHSIGSVVTIIGGYMAGITVGRQIYADPGVLDARIQNVSQYPISGPGADNQNGLSSEGGALHLGSSLRIGGRTAAYFYASLDASNVRFQTDKSWFLFDGTAPQKSNFAGRVTIGGGGTAAVTFSAALPNANYAPTLGGSSANPCWVSARTVNGFTINGTAGETVYWQVHSHF